MREIHATGVHPVYEGEDDGDSGAGEDYARNETCAGRRYQRLAVVGVWHDFAPHDCSALSPGATVNPPKVVTSMTTSLRSLIALDLRRNGRKRPSALSAS